MRDPKEIASSSSPRRPGVNAMPVFTSGSRDIQVASSSPLAAKTSRSAFRAERTAAGSMSAKAADAATGVPVLPAMECLRWGVRWGWCVVNLDDWMIM